MTKAGKNWGTKQMNEMLDHKQSRIFMFLFFFLYRWVDVLQRAVKGEVGEGPGMSAAARDQNIDSPSVLQLHEHET